MREHSNVQLGVIAIPAKLYQPTLHTSSISKPGDSNAEPVSFPTVKAWFDQLLVL